MQEQTIENSFPESESILSPLNVDREVLTPFVGCLDEAAAMEMKAIISTEFNGIEGDW